jgi:hypothetical protein
LDGSTSSSGLLKKNFTLTGGIPYFLEFDVDPARRTLSMSPLAPAWLNMH